MLGVWHTPLPPKMGVLPPQKEKCRRRGRCTLSTVTVSTKREMQKKRKMCFVYCDYLHKKRNAEEEEDVLCLL